MYFMNEVYEKIKGGEWTILQVKEDMVLRSSMYTYSFYCLNEEKEKVSVSIHRQFRDVELVVLRFARQEQVSKSQNNKSGLGNYKSTKSWSDVASWTDTVLWEQYKDVPAVRHYSFPSYKFEDVPVQNHFLPDTWAGPLILSFSTRENRCINGEILVKVRYRNKDSETAPLLAIIKSADGKFYSHAVPFKYDDWYVLERDEESKKITKREYAHKTAYILSLFPGDELCILQSEEWDGEGKTAYHHKYKFQVVAAYALNTREKQWINRTQEHEYVLLHERTHWYVVEE